MKTLTELHQKYGKDIHEAAEKYGLDECVLAGLIWQESRGNPNAVSPCGAVGLTQIMPATAKDRGYSIDTPRQQIFAGADYLAWVLKHFAKGSITRALAGYNAGVGRLRGDRWKKIKETTTYVEKIPIYAHQYWTIIAKEPEMTREKPKIF
jgi:soluble lytic murein transglycosylase-like protein